LAAGDGNSITTASTADAAPSCAVANVRALAGDISKRPEWWQHPTPLAEPIAGNAGIVRYTTIKVGVFARSPNIGLRLDPPWQIRT
jgi:hypothetical protein